MNKEQKPEAHRLAEKLSNAYEFADDIDHNDLKLAAMELESLHARVQELETPAAPLNVWQQAIDAELVSAHLGVAHNDATFEGAQKAIHELICWHIDVATDPATNGGQRLTDVKPIVWPVAMPEPVAAQVRFKRENDITWSRWKDCAVRDAREIEAYTYTLVNCNCWNYEVRFLYTEQQVRELQATPNNLPAQAVEKSATHGMDLHQRILHVGGRENAQTYIEFGSVAAVRALVAQVLRDLPDGAQGFAMPAPQPQAKPRSASTRSRRPLLTVRLTSFPESTGKRNWTAQFVRVKPWKGLVGSAGGITIAHGEFWNRVAYEAERARFLIGERDTEPHIRDYGTDVQTPDEWLREQIERAVVAFVQENK